MATAFTVGMREPTTADDMQRWHGPWWSSAQNSFVPISFRFALSQYIFGPFPPEGDWDQRFSSGVALPGRIGSALLNLGEACYVGIYRDSRERTARRELVAKRIVASGGAVLHNDCGPGHYALIIQLQEPINAYQGLSFWNCGWSWTTGFWTFGSADSITAFRTQLDHWMGLTLPPTTSAIRNFLHAELFSWVIEFGLVFGVYNLGYRDNTALFYSRDALHRMSDLESLGCAFMPISHFDRRHR